MGRRRGARLATSSGAPRCQDMARLAPVVAAAVAAITFLVPIATTAGASPPPPPTLDITSQATSWLPSPPQAPSWGPGPDEGGLVFTQGGTRSEEHTSELQSLRHLV